MRADDVERERVAGQCAKERPLESRVVNDCRRRVARERCGFSGQLLPRDVRVDAFLRLLDREGDGFLRKDQQFDIYEFIEG